MNNPFRRRFSRPLFICVMAAIMICSFLRTSGQSSQSEVTSNPVHTVTTATNKAENSTVPVEPSNDIVRVAVIGGFVQTGMWGHICEMFKEETGLTVVLVITGQRPFLAASMRRGEVDLLTMHSGDITTNLVSDGYGMEMRPWTRNNLVIVGPQDDPAGIAGMKNGAKALEQIVNNGCRFVDNRSIGPREMAHTLWKHTTIKTFGDWVVTDANEKEKGILQFARKHNAYVIVGRIPVIIGKMNSYGMRICVCDDPAMCRPYNVMVSNPKANPTTNLEGARKLADFLLSAKVQKFLASSLENQIDGVPLFFPVGKPIEEVMTHYQQ